MRPVNLALVAGLAVAFAACTSAPATSPAGTPGAVLRLASTNSTFDPSNLTVPANTVFAIEFENHDAVPHNVSIRASRPGFAGEVFGGPATRTSVFAGLPAGSYAFVCDVHPEMTGVLTSL